MKTSLKLAPLALLALLVHCGGGNKSAGPAPVKATRLVYSEPGSGTYFLKKNVRMSTPPNHLVLELWGPAEATGSGVSATFTVDATKAAWAPVTPLDTLNPLVANGEVFDLGSGTPILKAKVSGGTLIVTAAEKGLASPKALNGPLLRVALDLAPGADLLSGTTIPLAADALKCHVLLADGNRPAITVGTGTLTAQ